MATIKELDDLCRFAKDLPIDEREAISMSDLVALWRSTHGEDVEAVREALGDLDRGERGQPLEEFLQEIRRDDLSDDSTS